MKEYKKYILIKYFLKCHTAHKSKDFKKLEIVGNCIFIKSLMSLPFFTAEKWFIPFWNQYPTAIQSGISHFLQP